MAHPTILSSHDESPPLRRTFEPKSNAEHFEREVVALIPQLRRRALYLTKKQHRADDLVQDTLERALRFRESFRPDSLLRAWLMRIMQNLFVTSCRRRKTEQRVLYHEATDPNGWSTDQLTYQSPELFPPVRRALEQLPPRLREVVRLVDIEQRSYLDAAKEQQVPVGTIMSRLHRGRSRLKLLLNEAPLERPALASCTPVTAYAA